MTPLSLPFDRIDLPIRENLREKDVREAFRQVQENFEAVALDSADVYEGAWRAVGAAGEPGFQNGWVNFGGGELGCAFHKDSVGVVRVRGLVKSGPANSAIFTLPIGYRPPGNQRWVCLASGTLAQVYITAAGNVMFYTGSNTDVDLSPISFRAEG
jgi:hypothetical protein